MAIKYKSRIDKLVIWGASAYILPAEQKVMEVSRNIDKWNSLVRNFYETVYGKELKSLWNKHCDHYINNLNDICKNEVHKIHCPTLSEYITIVMTIECNYHLH